MSRVRFNGGVPSLDAWTSVLASGRGILIVLIGRLLYFARMCSLFIDILMYEDEANAWDGH